jgi:hypothetical protein
VRTTKKNKFSFTLEPWGAVYAIIHGNAKTTLLNIGERKNVLP